MSSTKADLRTGGLKRRDALDDQTRQHFASRLASLGPDLLHDFASFDGPPLVSLFSTIGSEPDMMPLASVLHGRGVPLSLPVDWSPGGPLIYRRWMPGDPLATGPLGIAEPLPDAPAVEVDVIFTPLAAFDRRGHRIGYGVGNVDRTIRDLRARKSVLVIGVAYAVQEEPEIPNNAHDEALDIIVTDREVITVRR